MMSVSKAWRNLKKLYLKILVCLNMIELPQHLIFIDANIYLRFFDKNGTEYARLLSVLNELKPHIFVTQQVVSEVTRNKLSVASKGLDNYSNQLKAQKISLPVQFKTATDTKITEWNQNWNKIHDQTNALQRELANLIKDVLGQIARNEDAVSKCLDNIFSSAVLPSQEEFQKAKRRKALGNPPGKHQDPIGDEISWQQILSRADGIQRLWIVSNDGDFFLGKNDNFYLNPFLYQELKAISQHLEIRVFDKLASAVKAYKELNIDEIPSIPPDDVIERIQEEEELPLPSSDITPPTLRTDVSICPRCSKQSLVPQTFPTGYVLRCFSCGFCTPLYEDWYIGARYGD